MIIRKYGEKCPIPCDGEEQKVSPEACFGCGYCQAWKGSGSKYGIEFEVRCRKSGYTRLIDMDIRVRPYCKNCKNFKKAIPEHTFVYKGERECYGVCTHKEATWKNAEGEAGTWEQNYCNFCDPYTHFEIKDSVNTGEKR